ncbi:tRNA threonylcarbamoyladenosine dehydratase [Adlercreutzia sp. ZJ304]|uniref:tRNA threonylcarbamoyladenosine dehydratase n=1 Tax=Adlercreutzia sp. ZJ304 TaxID=2709791 RepID=UPI0013ED0262|nr:tRNA threonylcarbamoyladenosine dehydratase [Adlercreutzia sp. ZJ304]
MSEDSKSRLRRLLGDEGLSKLSASYVAVIGLGGVGSACAEALVRGGVGRFLFVDKDRVEPSNINRQVIAFISTVGQRKVDVMRNMAADINPKAQVQVLDAFVLEENIAELLEPFGHPDYIVDAVDTLTAKAAIAQYANSREIPLISSMGMANRSDPTKLVFADLFETKGCPFCREMRKIARDRGVRNMQVLYSTEKPAKVKPQEGAPRRERTELGTHSYMPPIAGQMMAGYVIQECIRTESPNPCTLS